MSDNYDAKAKNYWQQAGEAEMARTKALNEGKFGDAERARQREKLYSDLALDAYHSKSWWYRTFGW